MTAKQQWLFILVVAVLSAVVLFGTVAIDPFAIFEDAYVVLAVYVPVVVIPLYLIGNQWRHRRAGWISTVLACLAIPVIGLCHLWLIVVAAGGV